MSPSDASTNPDEQLRKAALKLLSPDRPNKEDMDTYSKAVERCSEHHTRGPEKTSDKGRR